jgi:hypothetical protein
VISIRKAAGREAELNKKPGGDFMAYNYLTGSWQGFIQEIVYLVGRGYLFYHATELPERKRDKWLEIDRKLIRKYETEKSKFQRCRLKEKRVANFFFLRYESTAIIMHTHGSTDHVLYDDRFSDVCEKPVMLKVSDNISLVIYVNNEACSVRFSKETYAGFKAMIADVVKTKNRWEIIKAFNLINGIPAYSGIVEQKKRLVLWAVKQARKHQVALKKADLRLNTRRKIYKVWISPEA